MCSVSTTLAAVQKETRVIMRSGYGVVLFTYSSGYAVGKKELPFGKQSCICVMCSSADSLTSQMSYASQFVLKYSIQYLRRKSPGGELWDCDINVLQSFKRLIYEEIKRRASNDFLLAQ